MTKEQAKKFANCLKNNYTIDFNDMADFCDTVINALEQQPCEDCVSRKAVVDTIEQWVENIKEPFGSLRTNIENLPPVKPTHYIAEVRYSKDENCNERIEIECTHGTCKDCKNWNQNENDKSIGICDEFSSTRDTHYTTERFYCANYEKRGNENE